LEEIFLYYRLFIILLTCFFTIIQVFISIGYISKKKYSFLIENILIYFIYLFFIFMQYKFKFFIEWYLLAFVIFTVLGHVLIGEFFDLYKTLKYFDRCLHAFGSFSFSLFSYSFIAKTIHPVGSPRLFTVIFIINLGISLGAIFEIMEFAVDTFLKTKSQSGLKDTNVDLIADIIGSIAAGLTYGIFISAR
jgi:hypothetical protein